MVRGDGRRLYDGIDLVQLKARSKESCERDREENTLANKASRSAISQPGMSKLEPS
jgi:hypothetical protein